MIRYLYTLIIVVGSLSLQAQTVPFNAKNLLYLCDADVSVYAFEDGNFRKSKDFKDQLVSLKFPLTYGSSLEENSAAVSNSVFSYGNQVTLSSNQKLAYVIESYGEIEIPKAPGANVIEAHPSGQYITVIDLNNPSKPKALYRFPAGENPKSISLSPNNHYLAVCSEEYNRELQVFELDAEGKPVRIIKKPNNIPTGRISHASWLADGNSIVYLNQDAQQVGLIKVLRDGPTNQIIRLEGDSRLVTLEGIPVFGKFTPDQKYYLVLAANDLFLKDVSVTSGGTLFVIKMSEITSSHPHYLISKATLKSNPIHFDVHPDGSLIVVVQSESSTHAPISSLEHKGTVSVWELNLSGNLGMKQEVEMDGMLPNHVLFDKDGESLAISIFQYANFGQSLGGIEFFNFNTNSNLTLKKQEAKILLPRGIHSLFAIFDY